MPFGLSFKSIIFIAIVAFIIYSLIAWQKSGRLFGFEPYKHVDLINLLSFGNLYDGKKVCSRGYYVLGDSVEIFKVSLNDNQFARSAWVQNNSGRDIILTSDRSITKEIDAKLCGKYNFRRAGEWGNPPVWNHLLEVDTFETYTEASPLQ